MYLGRQLQFISYCVDNIQEWPAGFTSAASFTGSKFKNLQFREHYHGLSYSWTVCTKKMWLDKQTQKGK